MNVFFHDYRYYFKSMLMLLFNNWRKNRNSIFLSFVILFITLYTTAYYFIALGQSPFWAAVFYTNLSPLWYLPGPCLYWYVRGNLEDQIRMRKTAIAFPASGTNAEPGAQISFVVNLAEGETLRPSLWHSLGTTKLLLGDDDFNNLSIVEL